MTAFSVLGRVRVLQPKWWPLHENFSASKGVVELTAYQTPKKKKSDRINIISKIMCKSIWRMADFLWNTRINFLYFLSTYCSLMNCSLLCSSQMSLELWYRVLFVFPVAILSSRPVSSVALFPVTDISASHGVVSYYSVIGFTLLLCY